jgi:hypothetical protein
MKEGANIMKTIGSSRLDFEEEIDLGLAKVKGHADSLGRRAHILRRVSGNCGKLR